MKSARTFSCNIYIATLYQWGVALFMLWLTRFIFIAVNSDAIEIHTLSDAFSMAIHGLRFDVSAAAYWMLPFLILRLLPFNFTDKKAYLRTTRWVYIICIALIIAVSMTDVVFFRFTGSRMRWTSLQTAVSESPGIILGYIISYWWIVATAIALTVVAWWLYGRARINSNQFGAKTPEARTAVRIAAFVTLGFATFIGMRGRWFGGKSISIGDANAFVATAPNTNAVLNTPFTIIRSLGKLSDIPTLTFFSEQELAAIRNSEHQPKSGVTLSGKNVMIIIIESGGAEFIDLFARHPSDSTRGLMPFLDSLAHESLVCRDMMATGVVSTGGANAVLCGFPTFEPLRLMSSVYAATPFDAPARLLAEKGYSSTFYYGCTRGSYQIDQTAIASGFAKSIDRQSYPNSADFDGKWGIFDTAMAQFTANDLSTLPQPWFAAWFTISAHSPFIIPDRYDTSHFHNKEANALRGLEYTDDAIREFFTIASHQPWYSNTLFVITGDHGNRDLNDTPYDTPYLRSRIPFIAFAPDGSITPSIIDNRVMAQFDIAPTLLGLIGYDEPYISIGSDILDNDVPHYGITGNNGVLMITGKQYVITTDEKASRVERVYDIVSDPLMHHPVDTYDSAVVDSMLRWERALLQDLTTRLNTSRLTIKAK